MLPFSEERGNVPKVSSKNMVEPLKPSGQCASIPKILVTDVTHRPEGLNYKQAYFTRTFGTFRVR
jgi:hypothetical protein